VFDKTGTLTAGRADGVAFFDANGSEPGGPEQLSASERAWVWCLARQSSHPHSVRIAGSLANGHSPEPVESFAETPGCGIEGEVQGRRIQLGSRAWIEGCGMAVPDLEMPHGSVSWLAINGSVRGAFMLGNLLRPETETMLGRLSRGYELALLSGDNARERVRFARLFGPGACLLFNQSPLEKLDFVRHLQEGGRTVMMVGDGLNDAGALKQSDVGAAVVENAGAFSPASDLILEAKRVPQLFTLLSLAGKTRAVVAVSFVISALYNLAGVSIAAAGALSPVICAVLMPLSSVSVVLFACGATSRAARAFREERARLGHSNVRRMAPPGIGAECRSREQKPGVESDSWKRMRTDDAVPETGTLRSS